VLRFTGLPALPAMTGQISSGTWFLAQLRPAPSCEGVQGFEMRAGYSSTV